MKAAQLELARSQANADRMLVKSPIAGIQRVVEAPRDFKVERMSGDVKPGGTLSGKITGSLDKTLFNFDFELTLPAKDAAAGFVGD